MASYLQAQNLSKSFGPQVLFSNLNFNINQGEKIALIAPNGTGKSTLLKVIAGIESSDMGGDVKFMKEIRVKYLEQDPTFDPALTVFEAVFGSSDAEAGAIKEYEEALLSGNTSRIEAAVSRMDQLNCWQYEVRIKQILSSLKITRLDQKIAELSGGQVKRVALAALILNEPDLMILDEPTNHLDLEVIEYLEEFLGKTGSTILMVTHDRYFLDRVCNVIFELDNGSIHLYNGNYSYFLEKREERINNLVTGTERARNLLRGELEWMRRMPKARGTKAKYRIDAFHELKERASVKLNDKSIKINVGSSRTGNKIINCKDVCHSFGDIKTVENFTYNFARFEKVGIVGGNGAGKSTFLNLITSNLKPTSGSIDTGETIRFGYYTQEGLSFNPGQTVLETVQEIAEVVKLADGNVIPVTAFLTQFLFPPSAQHTKVEKLSGGERRRLYLVTVLMQSPNFLILDEPTNDLDILTLNVLEEYLINFDGSLIIVSHDRYFIDKIVDHIFVFAGDGQIKDFPGNYTQYRDSDLYTQINTTTQNDKPPAQQDVKKEREVRRDRPNKLSFKEKRELEELTSDIDKLEKEKSDLEAALSSGTLTSQELQEHSLRIGHVIGELDSKSDRWLELSERE